MTTKTPKKTKANTQSTDNPCGCPTELILAEIKKISERIDRLETPETPEFLDTPDVPDTPENVLVIETKEPFPETPEIVTLPQPQPVSGNTEIELLKQELSRSKRHQFYIYLFFVLVIIFLICSKTSFFSLAPISQGQSELTGWIKQQAQQLPSKYQVEIKTILRESYQETAKAILNKEITSTSDARLRLSQLIQAKILSLNRLTQNPKELETIIETMKPLSESIGKRLDSDVKTGKMQDDLESVQKVFNEISLGFK